uniref:Ataxin-2-like n=1 Tax=Petromyzon marinus TaxID=7757 RepID=A0AAJ7WTJ1_PETMA|nr:ataxin-2-like [Petromyzon marinus]
MTFLSVAERVFCVRAYYEGGRSLKAARRAFAVRYSARRPPSAKTVWKVVRKFEAHGSVCDRRAGRSGRPPMAATPGEERRGTPLLPGPRRAVAEAAEQLGVSLSSAYRLSRRLCEEGSGMLEREEELAPRESPERRSAPGQQRTEQQEQQQQEEEQQQQVEQQEEELMEQPPPSPCREPAPGGAAEAAGAPRYSVDGPGQGARPSECEEEEGVGPWEVVRMVGGGNPGGTGSQGRGSGRVGTGRRGRSAILLSSCP